jgi:drug/metabolite transporter (DMT)-like permease
VTPAKDAPAEQGSPFDLFNRFLTPAVRGMLLLNLGAALFGSNQVIIKTSEELMSPTALNALRFTCAAMCFVPFIPRALKSVPIPSATELGCWLTLGYTFQALGLSMTSASHGAFTGAFTVLTVPVLIGLSGKEVGRSVWFSAAAALFGISLLTGEGGAPNLGDLFCVASAVFFGVHKWRGETIVSGVEDAKSLVALQLGILGMCSIALAAPEFVDTLKTNGVSGTFELSKALPWGDILFMGVGTTALTLYIEMEALKVVSSATAALIYTSEPIWGATFAWIMLSERWGLQGWAGGALVVASSVYSQMSGESEKLKYRPDEVTKSASEEPST